MRTIHLPVAPALAGLVSLLAACAPSQDRAPAESASADLPFLADDYPAALAEARARKLPIFIETWAPW
jgi:hypothetical protein